MLIFCAFKDKIYQYMPSSHDALIHFVMQTVFDKLEPEEMRRARTRSNTFETIRGVFFLNRSVDVLLPYGGSLALSSKLNISIVYAFYSSCIFKFDVITAI